MVVWEKGRMKKSDYRKFIIRGTALGIGHAIATNGTSAGTAAGNGESPLVVLQTNVQQNDRQNDDFASMREVVMRRYRRLLEEHGPMPGLILIDGGIGQLHAAAEALEALGIINQPLASIAKKEEILYVLGQESEPIVLERHSPVLHLIQQIRDETHRFAVTFHRLRRGKRQTKSALEEIPGVGQKTARKLLKEFGSITNLQRAGVERLSELIPRSRAEKVLEELGKLQNRV
jgi:excinuclease ABC subunit C